MTAVCENKNVATLNNKATKQSSGFFLYDGSISEIMAKYVPTHNLFIYKSKEKKKADGKSLNSVLCGSYITSKHTHTHIHTHRRETDYTSTIRSYISQQKISVHKEIYDVNAASARECI